MLKGLFSEIGLSGDVMFRWFVGITLSVIAAAVIAGGVVWYLDRPSSYDECVVREMRGQPSVAMYTVQKVCAIRFRKEEELPLSYLGKGLDISMMPDFDKDPGVVLMGSKNFDNPPMIFTVTKNDTDYEITRAHVKVSHKWEADCSVIADGDWFDGPELIFKNNVANVNMPGELDEKTKLHRAPFCYRYTGIWGTPRKQ
ncbi:hypothetical protein [Nitrobacter vulgaris]|nr:hypothetical protein [Nitrobacter vulgaris]